MVGLYGGSSCHNRTGRRWVGTAWVEAFVTVSVAFVTALWSVWGCVVEADGLNGKQRCCGWSLRIVDTFGTFVTLFSRVYTDVEGS